MRPTCRSAQVSAGSRGWVQGRGGGPLPGSMRTLCFSGPTWVSYCSPGASESHVVVARTRSPRVGPPAAAAGAAELLPWRQRSRSAPAGTRSASSERSAAELNRTNPKPGLAPCRAAGAARPSTPHWYPTPRRRCAGCGGAHRARRRRQGREPAAGDPTRCRPWAAGAESRASCRLGVPSYLSGCVHRAMAIHSDGGPNWQDRARLECRLF